MRLTKHLTEAAKDASSNTALQEALHAVGLAIAQTNQGLTEADLKDKSKFDNAWAKFLVVDSDKEKSWKFLMDNPSWSSAIVRNVNAIRKSRHFSANTQFKYYRGKGVMVQVYTTARKYLKLEKLGRIGSDKWNPGDIWASTVSTIHTEWSSLAEYNEYIAHMLISKKLIGISLKKSGKVSKVERFAPDIGAKSVKYQGIKKPRAPLNTGINVNVDVKNVNVNVRSFSTKSESGIQGEVTGSGAARGGKATITPFVVKYKINLSKKSDIKKMIDNNDSLFNEVVMLYKDCGISFTKAQVEKDWIVRRTNKDGDVIDSEGGVTSKLGFFWSLISALQFGAYLNKNAENADVIVTGLYNYGVSLSSWSSEFLKVS